MNTLAKFLGIIISMGIIGGSVAGTLYHFDRTKVDIQEYKKHVAYTDIRFLEQYRRTLQQRIWELQRRYPSQYQTMPEYLNLVQELRCVDMKIRAFYNKGGR